MKDQKPGGIWDHSAGIRDHTRHKPWDRGQQCFEGSGIQPYHSCGIREQNLSRY